MDLQITYDLNALYLEVQNIKKHSSLPIDVTPIGETENILCFTIFYNHKAFAIIYTKEVFNPIFYLKQTIYKDISFQYYIQQNSVDEYLVVSQSDYQSFLQTTIAESTNYTPKSYTYHQLFHLLLWESLPQDEKIRRTILQVAEVYTDNNKAIVRFLKQIAKNIGTKKEYTNDVNWEFFSFSEKDEDELHRLFFRNGTSFRQVCRYCTLETLFQTLSNQTIRMYSLAGMNDNSEYRYAWDCFFREELPLEETEDCINCTYVLSCSSMKQKDSLEMWRLYGDDGKGVCLIFDVDKPENPLLLAKTIYEFVHENGRKKLDNKWRLLKHLTTELNNIGIPLKLRNQNKWLPFFKSGDYHYENEVRLLYEENDESNNFHTSHDWVLNNANSIFTPYVQFDLSDKGEQQKTNFPLKLKGIVLGPKCPEKEMNAKQIKNMLRRDPSLQRLNIDIQVSKITNYR